MNSDFLIFGLVAVFMAVLLGLTVWICRALLAWGWVATAATMVGVVVLVIVVFLILIFWSAAEEAHLFD